MENDGKPKTKPQSTNARQAKRFEWKCFFVTSSVRGKLKAVGRPVMLRPERSALETDNKPQEIALNVTEN